MDRVGAALKCVSPIVSRTASDDFDYAIALNEWAEPFLCGRYLEDESPLVGFIRFVQFDHNSIKMKGPGRQGDKWNDGAQPVWQVWVASKWLGDLAEGDYQKGHDGVGPGLELRLMLPDATGMGAWRSPRRDRLSLAGGTSHQMVGEHIPYG